jgi:proteasome accessory factor C
MAPILYLNSHVTRNHYFFMNDQAKLARMLKCISLLGTGYGLTRKQLAEKLEISERTANRYLATLEESGFILEKDFHGHHYIHRPVSPEFRPEFTALEVAHIRQLAAVSKSSPIMHSILNKVFEKSELAPVKDLVVRARLAQVVDDLNLGIEKKLQAVLKAYHSANSGSVSDRLVEPIELTPDLSNLLAYEPASKESKFFKLDRVAGVELMKTRQRHKARHTRLERDLFGMSGSTVEYVSMHLSLRAYSLMREEYPASVDYLHKEEGSCRFHGPVRGWAGIGRFVLGLPGEIENISPPAFIEYLLARQQAAKFEKRGR